MGVWSGSGRHVSKQRSKHSCMCIAVVNRLNIYYSTIAQGRQLSKHRNEHIYLFSSSTKTPPQSLGCRKTTGLPWAPILGSGSKARIPFFVKSLTAACTLSTSIQMCYTLQIHTEWRARYNKYYETNMNATFRLLLQKIRNGAVIAQGMQ